MENPTMHVSMYLLFKKLGDFPAIAMFFWVFGGVHSLKLTVRPWKWWFPIGISFSRGLFLGAMLNFGRVIHSFAKMPRMHRSNRRLPPRLWPTECSRHFFDQSLIDGPRLVFQKIAGSSPHLLACKEIRVDIPILLKNSSGFAIADSHFGWLDS